MLPQGRLSLTSGVTLTETDIPVGTALYYVPCGGTTVPVWDGVSFQDMPIVAGLSLILDADSGHAGYHQAAKIFDVFAFNRSGLAALGTGPAWSSDNARADDLDMLGGLLVNANMISLKFGEESAEVASILEGEATYLGSFRTIAAGQTADSRAARLLFNAYNQVQRPLSKAHTTNTWAYSVAALRAAGGGTEAQVEFLLGLTGGMVELDALGSVTNSSTAAHSVVTAIGIDSTTSAAPHSVAETAYTSATLGVSIAMRASYKGYPGLGYHTATKLEKGNATGGDTQTWIGAAHLRGNGIIGSMWG